MSQRDLFEKLPQPTRITFSAAPDADPNAEDDDYLPDPLRAHRTALRWLAARGLTCGPYQRGNPSGIMPAGMPIPPWSEMPHGQRAALWGRLVYDSGRMLDGSVTVEITRAGWIDPLGPIELDVP